MSFKNKMIIILTSIFSLVIYLFISIRGQYLDLLSINEKYIEIFNQNFKYQLIITIVSFIFIFLSIYINNIFIKKGLKKFFEEEKKKEVKLPNKSIAFVIATIGSVITNNIFFDKLIMFLNSAWFGKNDPIFNLDIGYYVFQKPFLETILTYLIFFISIITIYTIIYYIIVFNRCFEKGINLETLKKNTFIKQITISFVLIAILISLLNLLNTQEIIFDKFIKTRDGENLYGAGITDITIKLFGYIGFSIIIVLSTVMVVKFFKKNNRKKIFLWASVIPIYLLSLFILTIILDLIFVKTNELDKQKKYIEYNIDYTKTAYNLDTQEIEIKSTGTVSKEDLEQNQNIINNINLLNNNVILSNLNEYQTNLGYYTFNNTKISNYNINGINTLLYITPREILNNETRTYNNKTYEYTHGFGVISTIANRYG